MTIFMRLDNDDLRSSVISGPPPAGSSPPERATLPLADKPRPPRGRFQSDVDLQNIIPNTDGETTTIFMTLDNDDLRSSVISGPPPAGSSPPERATLPLADKPRPPRGRFQSEVDLQNIIPNTDGETTTTFMTLDNDDLRSPSPSVISGPLPAGSSPPERATSPLADKPRPQAPRGRFQSDGEGTSRRRPRPSSYDELEAKPTRSRFESMMDLGALSGNTSASDLLTRDSSDRRFIRQALIIREEGKPPTHFQLGNCIGRGQFGSVYRALNLNTGQIVAVKRIRLEGLKEDEVSTLMREVDLVESISHPNIVKYEGMARDQDTLSIVLEYAENGSLAQTLKAFGKLNERLVASYVVKILEGLHYLHSSNVVHCNLKAANILTTKNGNVKLSDFGVSLNLCAMEREIKDVAGTPNWMAPEVIELKGASPKSDIWSLACTVIELLTGRPPYADIANSMSVMFRIVEDDMPPLPEGCSPLLEDFLTQCFNKDPRKRPSVDLLCEHQWLKKNWDVHKV
ncbi:kinase-like domain-containing protein [Mycena latifolia]|nr:kinase-like domain-containing protein [Mycena latifolia]